MAYSDPFGTPPTSDQLTVASLAGEEVLPFHRPGSFGGLQLPQVSSVKSSWVAVDQFGCDDVRLTDDPFDVEPGTSTESGIVPGVLRGPAGLPQFLSDLLYPPTTPAR